MEQAETIREYLTRRDRWIRGLRIASWVLLLVMFALVFWHPIHHRYLRIGALAILCIILGAHALVISTTRCPRCGFDLRSKAATARWKEVAKDQCPQCGVSLDESLKLG